MQDSDRRVPFTNSALSSVPPVLILVFGGLFLTWGLVLHNQGPPDWTSIGGVGVLAFAAIFLSRFHISHSRSNGVSDELAGYVSLVSALAGVFGVQVLARTFDLSLAMNKGFLVTTPLLAQAMLTSALIGPSLGVFTLTVVSFLLGVSGALPIETIAVSWISGTVASHAVNPIKRRNDLLRAMGVTSMSNAVIAVGAVAIQVNSVWPVVTSGAWAALAAILACSIFWVSVAVIERVFGITSDWTLLELCSPEHPLLRELVIRAPGTYAHSVMVGNLAENAARSIDANPTLCRAMAYFHDVGKLVRPSHFIENQQGENVHDSLPPAMSARLIIQHTSDGEQMAREHKVPRIIVDSIMQHHGTTLVEYFFQKEKESYPERSLAELEQEFRYPGPKPKSKEAGILMLADGIEAMSRLIPRGETEMLEVAVHNSIEARRSDGQLDECDLTFKELRMIEKSFLRTLMALRHERIAYPNQEEHDVERRDLLEIEEALRPRRNDESDS